MVKIAINKKIVETINELPSEDRKAILNYLKIVESSSNPFSFGYRTISSKIGEIIFFINNYQLIAVVEKEIIKIIKLI
jgi:mRNA-degrading endonuclease RelE of RelBE toxin-antitoxin system